MVAVSATAYPRPIHPLHAIIIAFSFPLFLGALVSDLAYWVTFTDSVNAHGSARPARHKGPHSECARRRCPERRASSQFFLACLL